MRGDAELGSNGVSMLRWRPRHSRPHRTRTNALSTHDRMQATSQYLPPPSPFPLPRRSHVRYARPAFPPSDAGGLFNTKHFTHQDNSNKHSLPYIRCTLALAALAFFKTVFFTYESSSTEKLTACLLHRRRTTPAYRKSEPRIFHGNDR